MGLHAAAHVLFAMLVGNPPAQVDVDSGHLFLISIQRPFHHSLDADPQLLATIKMVVDIDPDLHLGFAQNP
jgi:hypothetical protein